MTNYREEFQALAEGLDSNRYYDAWRLLVMLWRSVWYHSASDWGRYRMKIWGMFTDNVTAAARTSSDLDAFLSRIARRMNLIEIAGNNDDRAEVARMLALPRDQRALIIRMLREDAAVLIALVRRWRDITKERYEEEQRLDEISPQDEDTPPQDTLFQEE